MTDNKIPEIVLNSALAQLLLSKGDGGQETEDLIVAIQKYIDKKYVRKPPSKPRRG